MCGNSKEKAGEWTHFSRILWRAPSSLPPRPSPRGIVSMFILSVSSGSNFTCWRVQSFCVFQMPPPWEPAWSRRHALAPYPLLPGPAEWKLDSPWLRVRGWTGGTAVPPQGIWFLSLWFHSLLTTFSKVLWAQNCFHNFIFFCIKSFILLFLKDWNCQCPVIWSVWHFSMKACILDLQTNSLGYLKESWVVPSCFDGGPCPCRSWMQTDLV